MRLAKLLLYFGYCSIGTVLALLAVNPANYANVSQRAILHEYLAAFCTKDERHDKQFVIGTAAAMSRIVVEANLGTVALAEYAKCKAR